MHMVIEQLVNLHGINSEKNAGMKLIQLILDKHTEHLSSIILVKLLDGRDT